MNRDKYMKPRDTRTYYNAHAGRFRGGKLKPLAAVPFRESESGVIDQTITLELDAVAGRLLSEIQAEVYMVYVPALAVDKIKNPTDANAGIGEIFREKLLQGVAFDYENENAISRSCNVIPRSIGGVQKVNEAVRLGHIAAVNYLRQRKHVKATLLDNTAMTVTPALLSMTVLEILNGVLDPEDRVNGLIEFNTPAMNLPVRNLGVRRQTTDEQLERVADDGQSVTPYGASNNDLNRGKPLMADTSGTAYGSDLVNPIHVVLPEGQNNISLTDMYQAEKMDMLARELREILDKNPEYGEEIVTRVAHGLSVETGRQPFVMYHKSGPIRNWIARAMDGASLDVMQTETMGTMQMTVPVPATEFGGIVYTFVSVKPDEKLARQPDPVLSDVWTARNYTRDELAIDPVPVTMRDLDAECGAANEGTVALYVGNNHLLKRYATYGFARDTDLTTVAAQTAIWQLEVPLSVSPDSVIYPDNLTHYPFKDQNADVVQYNISTEAVYTTPIIFGPTPVEELAEIETANLFEEGA